MHTKPWVRARANRDYWENLKPGTGRPFSSSMSKLLSKFLSPEFVRVFLNDETSSVEDFDISADNESNASGPFAAVHSGTL